MVSDFNLTLVLCLIPIALGVLGNLKSISFPILRSIGLTVIVLEAGGFAAIESLLETDPSIILLTSAVLLSGFCAILGQQDSKIALPVLSSIMIVLGLSLGALRAPVSTNSFFLIGILAYATNFQVRLGFNTFRAKLILVQLFTALILSSAALVVDNISPVLVGLLLGVTLLPLAPFHLPFVSIVGSTQGALSSFWVVVFLVLGLHEMKGLQLLLPANLLSAVQILALVSALYSSLKCLGQNQVRNVIAYATVAHVSLLWCLPDLFSDFSRWGIPFGTVVAFVMSGFLLTFSFVQHRYGLHSLGVLPGLGSSMPQFGSLFTLLITIAMLLPIFPVISGLMPLQAGEHQVTSLLVIVFTFLTVWLLGSWYFSHLLHQTVFGKVRPDIPYTDLRYAETVSLGLLILSASGTGLLY